MRFIAVLTAFVLTFSLDLLADERQEVYVSEKNYDDMTSAELTKAKRLAEKVKIRPLVACADPGNLPLSSMEIPGFDNRIATLLAEKMGTSMRFFWRPFLERGLTRETFANRECDLLLGMPYGYQSLLTTMPIYRSTYVMAYPESKPLTINGLDDPKLRNIKIGTYQHSGLREALTRKGVAENIIVHPIRQDTDINPDHQQWRQLLELVSGELDAVGIWGPFAGYAKTVENAPIDYFPVNLLEDKTPLEFSLAIGMRKNDVILKYALDKAITENAQEIADILTEYGVPLVACSQCAVQGELPSHGSYYQSFINEAESRYLAPLPKSNTQLDTARATEDQKVGLNKLKGWLADGADLNEELSNAVLAADETRIRYLIEVGADINLRTSAGFTLAHETAKYRDSDTLAILLEQGIDKNAKDAAGWTPLIHGAYRNHVPTVALLASHKADMEAKTQNGYTALGLAIGERKFWAAKALIEAGADVNAPSGEKGLTPLMLIAIHKKSAHREQHIIEGAEPGEIANLLIAKGAEVNAADTADETALMFAAANNNAAMIGLLIQAGADPLAVANDNRVALDIARENRHDEAEKALRLFTPRKKSEAQ